MGGVTPPEILKREPSAWCSAVRTDQATAPTNLQQPFLKDAMMPEKKSFKVAILWRGDLEARQAATPANNRFHRIFEELAEVGIDAEPAVYDEDFADEVREQLLGADGVLVWVDPIHQG
jgi:hypothetical protein